MTRKDLSAILPDGRTYEFWEKDPVWERELFVSNTDPAASDDNDGSKKAPFRTIGKAAKEATPGTRIRIHAGIYRECVKPEQGGTDPEHMISYEAYGDGEVIIRASEEVTVVLPSEGCILFRSQGANPGAEPAVWKHNL